MQKKKQKIIGRIDEMVNRSFNGCGDELLSDLLNLLEEVAPRLRQLSIKQRGDFSQIMDGFNLAITNRDWVLMRDYVFFKLRPWIIKNNLMF